MVFKNSTKGYSLVEVMVAITILMLSIIGPMTIAMKSYQAAQYTRQQTTAFFLAQEGITIANALRNNGGAEAYTNATIDPWDWVDGANLDVCFAANGCNIDFRDNSLFNNIADCTDPEDCRLLFDADAPRATYQLATGEPTAYTRVLQFELVSPDEVTVRSTVSWDAKLLGDTQEVQLSTSLFNLYKR